MKTAESRELYKRIKSANNFATLNRLEKSCERIYNAGLITPSEFMRLDVKIMEKLAEVAS